MTFMIGANGAGKSNALDALRFVNWMGRGERLDDIDTRLGSGPGQIRGTPQELFNCGKTEFDFDLTVAHAGDYAFHQTLSNVKRSDAEDDASFMVVHAESLYRRASPSEV